MVAGSLAFGLSCGQSSCETEASVERPPPLNLVITAKALGSHFPCDSSWCQRGVAMFGHRLFSVEARDKHCSISSKSSSGGGCSRWWHSQFVTWLENQLGVFVNNALAGSEQCHAWGQAEASPPGGASVAAQARLKSPGQPSATAPGSAFPKTSGCGDGAWGFQ